MNKQEFLKLLRKQLNVLKDTEIDDIIQEYSLHIDEEVASGKDEVEAVKNFGEINLLAEEILDAYQVKTKKPKKIIAKAIKMFSLFDEELLDIVHSLPRGTGFSHKFSLFTLYIMIWGIMLTAMIFLFKLTGIILGFAGPFGSFLNVVLILFGSVMMVYVALRVITHVWQKRK